jgi:hypothetical protein
MVIKPVTGGPYAAHDIPFVRFLGSKKMCRPAMSPGNVPVAIGADRRSRELLKSLAVNGIFGVGGGFSGIFIFVIDAFYKQPNRAQQPSQDNNTT